MDAKEKRKKTDSSLSYDSLIVPFQATKPNTAQSAVRIAHRSSISGGKVGITRFQFDFFL